MKPEPERPTEPMAETGDPLIDEIRQVRHEISARFDHDPYRLVAYYMELQQRHADQMEGAEPRKGKSSAA